MRTRLSPREIVVVEVLAAFGATAGPLRRLDRWWLRLPLRWKVLWVVACAVVGSVGTHVEARQAHGDTGPRGRTLECDLGT